MNQINNTDYRSLHLQKGESYDDTLSSSSFDAYMDKWEVILIRNVLQDLFPISIPRYLDFACGTGRITQRIAPIAQESYGVDISESMLGKAREKCPSATFIHADLTRDTLDIGQFDLVTAFRFFGNAQDDLRESALTAMVGRLRPGGYLILNNHRNPKSLSALIRSITGGPASIAELTLTHAKLDALLKRHGLEIVVRRPIGFWIFRDKLTASGALESNWADRLESVFRFSWLSTWSPDSLLVARKIADPKHD